MARAKMAHEAEIVCRLIRLGDVCGLKKFTSAGFDWSQCVGDGSFNVPPLHAAIVFGIWQTDLTAEFQEMIQYMLNAGADPMQQISDKNGDRYSLTCGKDDSEIEVAFAGHSALSLALAWLAEMQLLDNQHWDYEFRYLQNVVPILTDTCTQTRPKVAVDARALDLWESVLELTSTHNVAFETAGGQVTAHDHVLMVASPVLKAMLESTMKEGVTKKIQVTDSSKEGVVLFLEVLYTCAFRSNPDYRTVMDALDIAHRWQTHSVVEMLAEVLEETCLQAFLNPLFGA